MATKTQLKSMADDMIQASAKTEAMGFPSYAANLWIWAMALLTMYRNVLIAEFKSKLK